MNIDVLVQTNLDGQKHENTLALHCDNYVWLTICMLNKNDKNKIYKTRAVTKRTPASALTEARNLRKNFQVPGKP